ncbi:MAG: transporter [Verrucomicrobiales bacterium]
MTSKTLALLAVTSLLAHAEEGGSGHYQPGSMASFADGVPLEETFIVRYNFLMWDASAEATRTIPIANLLTLGADIESYANGITLLWRPPFGEINHHWSYAMSATIPYVDLDITADIITPLGTVKRGDSISGLGDIVLMPVMLNQNFNDDFNINYRLGIYAPTGRYDVGRLANTGKNYWTLEPAVAFMYLGKKNGREASLFLGGDYNFENPDTDYQTGVQIHADGTLAQHFPLWGGLAGAGVNGYWHEQVEADSGSGATLGDFKARTAGLGPVLSYASKLGNVDLIAELKWLHEFETRNRPEGDYVWFKFLMKF